MIIKPLQTDSEFDDYGKIRFEHSKNKFTASLKNNLAKSPSKHEFDAYDYRSFHFGAFNDGKMHACARVVNDNFIEATLSCSQKKSINLLARFQDLHHGLTLKEYVSTVVYDEVESFFHSLRAQGKNLSEIGRLIRLINEGEKYLTKYLICYALAFNRFSHIDFCFFVAKKFHCAYYERLFNCKYALKHISFSPITDGEPCYLMQASMSDFPEEMDDIISRIVSVFERNGEPCAVNLNDIR